MRRGAPPGGRGRRTRGGGSVPICTPGEGGPAPGRAGRADSARRAELLTQVRELLSELRYLGVSQQELLNLVKEVSPS